MVADVADEVYVARDRLQRVALMDIDLVILDGEVVCLVCVVAVLSVVEDNHVVSCIYLQLEESVVCHVGYLYARPWLKMLCRICLALPYVGIDSLPVAV